MELIEVTTKRCRAIFWEEAEIVVSAPGQVNLIGQHADHVNLAQ